jgi:hypothetical protein
VHSSARTGPANREATIVMARRSGRPAFTFHGIPSTATDDFSQRLFFVRPALAARSIDQV